VLPTLVDVQACQLEPGDLLSHRARIASVRPAEGGLVLVTVDSSRPFSLASDHGFEPVWCSGPTVLLSPGVVVRVMRRIEGLG
jgi:hypothetical protein